jgi:two-component system, OmpR family, response regulator
MYGCRNLSATVDWHSIRISKETGELRHDVCYSVDVRFERCDYTVSTPHVVRDETGPRKLVAMKILVIEDDQSMSDFVVRGLRESGHVIDHTTNGRDGLFMAADEKYDAMVIDRMLPGVDGLTIVKMLRSTGNHTPVIFLTTMGGIDDRVEGLEAGADDYLVKPFAFAELLARLSALLRRPPVNEVKTLLRFADLEMDLLKRVVTRAGKLIDLQPQEFRLLEYLLRSEGRVVTRTMLLESVWDFHFDPQTSIVETHISRLRGKIDREFPVGILKTIRGVGYCLRATP